MSDVTYRFPLYIVIVDLMGDIEGSLVCFAKGKQKYIVQKMHLLKV